MNVFGFIYNTQRRKLILEGKTRKKKKKKKGKRKKSLRASSAQGGSIMHPHTSVHVSRVVMGYTRTQAGILFSQSNYSFGQRYFS